MIVEDTGQKVTAEKSAVAAQRLKKTEADPAKGLGKLLEVAFWMAGGYGPLLSLMSSTIKCGWFTNYLQHRRISDE